MAKYVVIKSNGKKAFDETYTTKKSAKQDILYFIKGASDNAGALKGLDLKVRKIKK